jgi:hypothetical protein
MFTVRPVVPPLQHPIAKPSRVVSAVYDRTHHLSLVPVSSQAIEAN